MGHFFFSYSMLDGKDIAVRLADALAAGPPPYPVWLDVRKLRSGEDWDEQIVEAIRGRAAVLFLMTKDSVQSKSECKREWTRSPVQKARHPAPRAPGRGDALSPRARPVHRLHGGLRYALARLHTDLAWRATPEGALQALRERLVDAQRELPRAEPGQGARIEADIAELERQIAEQERIVANPQEAKERVQKTIEAGLERERHSEKPVGG